VDQLKGPSVIADIP